MSIDAVTWNSLNASNASSKTSMSSMTTNDFIKLLLTQLKNQDPTDPMDSSEMLSQFSTLTQLQMTQKTYDATQTLIQTASTGYIGKKVSYPGSSTNLISAQGDQGGSIQYTLAGNAGKVSVTIYDDSGKIVRSGNLGSVVAGTYSYSWDGTDNNGAKVNNGNYTISFLAKDMNGNPLSVSTITTTAVTGVYFKDNTTYLMTALGEIPLSAVKGISN